MRQPDPLTNEQLDAWFEDVIQRAEKIEKILSENPSMFSHYFRKVTEMDVILKLSAKEEDEKLRQFIGEQTVSKTEYDNRVEQTGTAKQARDRREEKFEEIISDNDMRVRMRESFGRETPNQASVHWLTGGIIWRSPRPL